MLSFFVLGFSSESNMSELNPKLLQEKAGVEFSAAANENLWKHSKSCHNQPTSFCSEVFDDFVPVKISPRKTKHVRNLEADFSHQRSVSLFPADYSHPSDASHFTRITRVDPSYNLGGHGCSRTGVNSSTKAIFTRSGLRKSTLIDLQTTTSGELISDERLYGSSHGSGTDKQAIKESKPLILGSEVACKTDDGGKDISPRCARAKAAVLPAKETSKSISNRALSYTMKKLFSGSITPAKKLLNANLTPDDAQFDQSISHGCLPSKMSMGARKLASVAPVEATLNHSVTENCIAGGLIMHTHLYCSIRDGVPSYTFVSDSEYILSAKSLCSTSCDGDLTYGFYSLWRNHPANKKAAAPSLLAKMRVSCKLRLADHTNSCSSEANPSMDLEYVLMEKGTNSDANATLPNSSKRIFYSSCERSLQSQISPPNLTSETTIRPSGSFEYSTPKSTRKNIGSTETKILTVPSLTCSPLGSRCSISSHSHNLFRSSQPNTENDEDFDHSRQLLPETYSEIAAIVIRFPCTIHDMDVESSTDDDHHHPEIEYLPNLADRCSGKQNDPHFRINNDPSKVTIILPAGDHGRPVNGSCGPQPIVERWRSGGKCDCGSWDLGCGLTILDGQSEAAPKPSDKSAPNAGSIFWKAKSSRQFPTMSFQTISNQVRDQEVVCMSLAHVSEGVFSVEFQAHVSPLQAFASAMAVVHSRKPFCY